MFDLFLSLYVPVCRLSDSYTDMIMADGISNLCNDLMVNLAYILIVVHIENACLFWSSYIESLLKFATVCFKLVFWRCYIYLTLLVCILQVDPQDIVMVGQHECWFQMKFLGSFFMVRYILKLIDIILDCCFSWLSHGTWRLLPCVNTPSRNLLVACNLLGTYSFKI